VDVIGTRSSIFLGFKDRPNEVNEEGQPDQADDDVRHESDPFAGVGEKPAQPEKQEDHDEVNEIDHGRPSFSET
jgi:hypothetical protein